jgi:hypothetical protein
MMVVTEEKNIEENILLPQSRAKRLVILGDRSVRCHRFRKLFPPLPGFPRYV